MLFIHSFNHSIAAIGIFILCGGTGCGQSPLFNHLSAEADSQQQEEEEERDGDEGLASAASPSTSNPDCPLSFDKLKLCAQVVWTKRATPQKKGEFILKFWDPVRSTFKGPYLTPRASVFIDLWMPSMGHGSSPVKVSRIAGKTGKPLAGRFRVSDIYFVMPGSWEIRVKLLREKTILDETKVAIKI